MTDICPPCMADEKYIVDFIREYSRRYARFKFLHLSGLSTGKDTVQDLYNTFISNIEFSHLEWLRNNCSDQDSKYHRVFLYLLRTWLEWNSLKIIAERASSENESEISIYQAVHEKNSAFLLRLGFASPSEAFWGKSILRMVEERAEIINSRIKETDDFTEQLLCFYNSRPKTLSQLHTLIYKSDMKRSVNDVRNFYAKVYRALGLNEVFSENALKIRIQKFTKMKSRSFCVSDCSGEDIYVVVSCRSDRTCFSGLLHEMGHACSVSWSAKRDSSSNIYLDPTMTESFAYLFEKMVDLNAFRTEFGLDGISNDHDLIDEYSCRRNIILSLLEAFFYGDPRVRGSIENLLGLTLQDKDLNRVYSDICYRLLNVRPDDGDAIMKITPELYSFRYLSAFDRASNLLDVFVNDCGEEWYKRFSNDDFVDMVMSSLNKAMG